MSYTVYNRLSVLLKSLLAITRVTPAYKLSRKQGHDYVILYRQVDIICLIMQLLCCFTQLSLHFRIYFGEVQLSGLGEGNKNLKLKIFTDDSYFCKNELKTVLMNQTVEETIFLLNCYAVHDVYSKVSRQYASVLLVPQSAR